MGTKNTTTDGLRCYRGVMVSYCYGNREIVIDRLPDNSPDKFEMVPEKFEAKEEREVREVYQYSRNCTLHHTKYLR